jgi:hypothetical protein
MEEWDKQETNNRHAPLISFLVYPSTLNMEEIYSSVMSDDTYRTTKRYIQEDIVTCMSDFWRGFGLQIGFIDHFNIRFVNTLNYSAIAYFRDLQITTAHA